MISNAKNVRDMKLIGLRNGIPDYWIILKNNKIIAIEFKASKGKLSEEQKAIGEILQRHDINYKVCRSSHEAAQFVLSLVGESVK